MDITIYLPDELGLWAKSAGLPLSAMLRAAVQEERQYREAIEKASDAAKPIKLQLEDDEGRTYTGRFTGVELVENLYLKEDGTVLFYDEDRQTTYSPEPTQDLEEFLAGCLRDHEDYIEACHALGITPEVEI